MQRSATVCVVKTADRLPVLFDQPRWIKPRLNHHRIGRRMAEQCRDDMRRGIVVQMFGGKHPPAVVRQ